MQIDQKLFLALNFIPQTSALNYYIISGKLWTKKRAANILIDAKLRSNVNWFKLSCTCTTNF